MKIQSIKTVYFSATGNTKNVVKLIGETIARLTLHFHKLIKIAMNLQKKN